MKHNLIGQIGEFEDLHGYVCQCVVTGYEPPPFQQLLIVDYVTAEGKKVCGANIGIDDFMPDSKTRPRDDKQDDWLAVTTKLSHRRNYE